MKPLSCLSLSFCLSCSLLRGITFFLSFFLSSFFLSFSSNHWGGTLGTIGFFGTFIFTARNSYSAWKRDRKRQRKRNEWNWEGTWILFSSLSLSSSSLCRCLLILVFILLRLLMLSHRLHLNHLLLETSPSHCPSWGTMIKYFLHLSQSQQLQLSEREIRNENLLPLGCWCSGSCVS